MYLHLGNDFMVNTKEIIGIFDIENTSVSKKKRVVNCTYEMPKSFVVCLDCDFTETVYISQMSCQTLLKRFNSKVDQNNYKKLK